MAPVSTLGAHVWGCISWSMCLLVTLLSGFEVPKASGTASGPWVVGGNFGGPVTT